MIFTGVDPATVPLPPYDITQPVLDNEDSASPSQAERSHVRQASKDSTADNCSDSESLEQKLISS